MEPIVKRPWGEFEILGRFFLDENEVVIKKITVSPSSKLSLQSHAKRSEQWNVVSGEGTFVIGEKNLPVKAGDCASIALNEKHRLINESAEQPLVVVEVDSGTFDENDIVRYEDDYGREQK